MKNRRIPIVLYPLLVPTVLGVLVSCAPPSLKATIDDMVFGWTREVTLTSPENSAELAEKTPLLDWEDAGGATGYQVQISETKNFDGITPIDIDKAVSEYEIPDELTICDTRYWRVRGVKDGIPSDKWSETRSFEISVSPKPVLVGQLTSDDDLAAAPIDLAVKGDYAYITHTSGIDELTIVDISNPFSPKIANTYTYGTGLRPKFTGDYLYCYDNSTYPLKILKVDFSNPLNPTSVGNPCPVVFDHDNNSGTSDLEYNLNMCLDVSNVGGGLLVAVYDANVPTSTGIMRINFTDPSSPTIEGFDIETDGQPFAMERAVATVIFTENGKGVRSFSLLSVPNADTYLIEDMAFGFVEISENYAYVTNTLGPLTILDISNPSSLTHVYTYDPGEGTIFPIVSGHYLFTGLFTSEEFTVLDISDPSAPETISTGNPGWICDIVGNYAYGVELSNGKFNIWDLVPEDE